jgi:tRNA(Ile)-lysidine synthase
MNKIELEAKVVGFVQRHSLIPPEEIVVIGVSGGADSVCLLHVLAKWQKELGIKLHVAHLNHRLRGVESEADAKYVSDLAASLGIPVTIDRQDVAAYRAEKKGSIEEAARELRYVFLAKTARKVGANRIAIGHTKDDQVETILMHILRGTGITGLRGLAPCSPMAYDNQGTLNTGQWHSNLLVIRPLLDITREETMSYCQEHQLDPRIDSSNLSLSFYRNRLRLQLLPLLRQYNPSVEQALLRLADIAKEANAFIEQQASELWDGVARQENKAIHLNKGQTVNLPIALQRQLLRAAIARLAGDTRDIEANHIEAVKGLLNKPVGKRISLPHGLVCYGEYDELVIACTGKQFQLLSSCPFPPLQGKFPLKVPGDTVLSGWKVRASVVPDKGDYLSLQGIPSPDEGTCQSNLLAAFDLYKTGTELFVRHRRPEDRFQPLGMNVPKKLHEFMVDAKIPLSWRGHVPIVCSPQQIIWVVGWRIDDRVKITEATKEILRLEFIKS